MLDRLEEKTLVAFKVILNNSQQTVTWHATLFFFSVEIYRPNCFDLKQARPRVAKVAQIAYEVAEQFNCRALKRMEQYNNTRRWRCYEAALLMKKNEIRTDEEAPLTTPVDASVLEYYRASPEERIRLRRTFSERSEILF